MPRELISAVVSCYAWYDFHMALARPCEALSYWVRVVLASQPHFGCMSLMPSGNCIIRHYDHLYEHESFMRSCLILGAMYWRMSPLPLCIP